MATLVIETATSACSIALIEDGRVLTAVHEIVSRGHAERLLPMIAALPGGGRATAILVDCGPGSFTGVRVGLAAAIGLGIGWGVPVTGYSSLALMAVAGFAARPECRRIAAVMEGGHGEVFVQQFADRPFAALAPLASLKPEAALEQLSGVEMLGNGVARLRAVDPMVMAEDALPDAAHTVLLPHGFDDLAPKPIYGRAPDAKPQAPR